RCATAGAAPLPRRAVGQGHAVGRAAARDNPHPLPRRPRRAAVRGPGPGHRVRSGRRRGAPPDPVPRGVHGAAGRGPGAARLDAVRAPWRGYVAVCAFAGLRLGEASALRVSDVDFLRRTITVARQVQSWGAAAAEVRAPKYGSERTVYAAPGL